MSSIPWSEDARVMSKHLQAFPVQTSWMSQKTIGFVDKLVKNSTLIYLYTSSCPFSVCQYLYRCAELER